MRRSLTTLIALCCLLVSAPAAGQVVESTPSPARTDQSVTITFHADRGSKGLEDCGCDVYAHTGLITSASSNDTDDWQYVMDEWPENRPLTKLEKVGDNTYELTIDDIRNFYSQNRTGAGEVPPKSQEQIQRMAFVFRNADGSLEGKSEGGGNLFVDVNDVGSNQPFLAANILSPDADPPLYPFITATDTTVDVTVTADTANVSSFDKLRLLVDGQPVDSSTTDSLTYQLSLNQPNRFQIRAEATASTTDGTLTDALETFLIRAPDVVDEPRPQGVQDGINYNSDGSVTLSLNAPKKDFAYVLGDFNDWEIDDQYFMKRETDSDGVHWWLTLPASEIQNQTEYAFQYFVDGQHRVADPYSHKVLQPVDESISEETYPNLKPYPDSLTENAVSVLEKGRPEFTFENPDFQPPPRNELVVYELLIRDFLEQSNFQTLTDTLDYLDSLGVNAIELMPVSEFFGNNSWGYNPLFHLALEKSYGTRENFKKFVQAAHNRDIAVILDVVYNHIDTPSPLRQLYSSAAESPFLESGDDRGVCGFFFEELNQGNPFIQNYIDRANRYWIEEFNVDGFRYDLAKCVADGNGDVVAGWKDVSDYVWNNVDPNTYMILEFFGSTSEENQLGGYRDDDGDTGSMMTWHNMNGPYSEADMGYVGGAGSNSSDLSDTYYETRSGYDQPSFIAYMESHDEQWLMRKKKEFGNESGSYSINNDLETALNRQKLSGAFYLTIPGPRMLWQFGELGYGWGENECLEEDSGDGPCPESAPGRTGPKPVRWEYRDPQQHPERVKLYDAWSALLELRSQHDVFTSLQTDVSLKVADSDVGRRIVLEHDSMDAVVLGNFGVESTEVSANFPSSGTWYDFYTGQRLQIGGDETDAAIPLSPGEFHIYTSEAVAFPDSGLVPFESAAPPPAAPSDLSVDAQPDQYTISWSASASSDVTAYLLYRGPSADFDTTGNRIARLDPGTTTYTDTDVSGGSLFYRVAALDDDGEVSPLVGPVQGFFYPQSLTLNASYSFGDGNQQDYRLAALAGAVDRPLEETFPGSAGDQWQAYWDNGADSDFFVQFDGSDTFTLAPGRGFWVISDSSWSVSEQVSTVSLEEGNVVTIDLHEGWNIISNPFDQTIPWGEVGSANGTALSPLWAFDGSFSETSDFQSARTGQAYYFNNNRGLQELTIPYAVASSSQSTARAKAADGPATLVLKARQGDALTSTLRLGWDADAADQRDVLDWAAPPTRFSALSLRSAVRSSAAERGRMLARDIRARDEGGISYDLTLTAQEKRSVFLQASNLSAFGDQEVRLVNEGRSRAHDLRRKQSVQVRPTGASTELTLLVGTEEYVEAKQNQLTASSLQLHPGYPNPFREQTTLRYTVPESGTVTLEVFDILGRRVRVLVDDRKEQGTYQVRWGGANASGQSVASGVYLGRLTFEGKTKTQKIVVVR